MAKELADKMKEAADTLEQAKAQAAPSTQVSDANEVSEDGAADTGELPVWNCRVEGAPQDEQWTVGEIFGLVCEGPTASFNSTELSFKEKNKSGYELRILEVKQQTENKLDMIATTYVPKPHQFMALTIEDQGQPVVKVEPFNLQVKSLITDPQQKFIGPAAAIQMSYPLWIWLVLGAVILGSAFFGLFRINRRTQMRRVIEELKAHNTALGAFNQFNKDLRTLGRKHIFGDEKSWSEMKKQRYLENLDEIFRMYLLREFYVPALDWNSGLVVRTIAKQDKRKFQRYGTDLQKFLKELDRAKADVEKLQVHDCQQLTQMAKRVSQSIWRVRRAS